MFQFNAFLAPVTKSLSLNQEQPSIHHLSRVDFCRVECQSKAPIDTTYDVVTSLFSSPRQIPKNLSIIPVSK